MAKTATKILKSSSLSFDGPIKIENLDTKSNSATPVQNNQQMTADAKAIIVDNDPLSVTIEVTCNCGKKLYLKCNYNTTQETKT